MNQVSSKLRRVQGGYNHYCPACKEMHILPDSWQFDGNLSCPTFRPSFKHEGWVGGGIGVCHYNLVAGKLQFCDDCSHLMKGQVVDLPDLPEEFRDSNK